MNLGLKSQPKLNRHNEKCLVEISDKNTQGVSPRLRVNKTGFSKTKRSGFSSPYLLFVIWLFVPISSFCDLFIDMPPYLGANNI